MGFSIAFVWCLVEEGVLGGGGFGFWCFVVLFCFSVLVLFGWFLWFLGFVLFCFKKLGLFIVLDVEYIKILKH